MKIVLYSSITLNLLFSLITACVLLDVEREANAIARSPQSIEARPERLNAFERASGLKVPDSRVDAVMTVLLADKHVKEACLYVTK